jgi:hypothetical protein
MRSMSIGRLNSIYKSSDAYVPEPNGPSQGQTDITRYGPSDQGLSMLYGAVHNRALC